MRKRERKISGENRGLYQVKSYLRGIRRTQHEVGHVAEMQDAQKIPDRSQA
jgi:hypothetical protein